MSTPYAPANGIDSSAARVPAYSPPSGWMNPVNAGQWVASSGRATSSVTRPPPAGRTVRPSSRGRSKAPLQNTTPGSVSSGPSSPTAKSVSNSRRSESRNTTMSPSVAANDFHSASPLPGTSPRAGRISPCATTRAPAPAATAAVESVEWESTTTSSSINGTPITSSVRSASTISPTVVSSFRAGSTTETRRSALAATSSSGRKSAAR